MRSLGRLGQVLIALTLLSCSVAQIANAQYMYLDADGDSASGTGDVVQPVGTPTSVDVWIVTDRNRDGSVASCASGADSLTINSYEVILHAIGGTVTYGNVTNRMAEYMTTQFGYAQDSTEFYVGFGGGTSLAPGRYRLCSLEIAATSGGPRIEIAPSTALSGVYLTSFGSRCGGTEEDNTLKLGHEWLDADGLGAPETTEGPTVPPPSLPDQLPHPPDVTGPTTANGQEGDVMSLVIHAFDPDGNVIDSFTADTSQLPSENNATWSWDRIEGDSFDPEGAIGTLHWTPTFRDAGTYHIIFRALAGGLEGTLTTTLDVANVIDPDRPWTYRSVRLQLPAPGYKVDVRYYSQFCAGSGGLCKQERLTAGDSGQVYIPVVQAPAEETVLWDKIHVEFPAANVAAYFTVPNDDIGGNCWEPYLEQQFLNSDNLALGAPVDWFPNDQLPPYNYDYVPTTMSASMVRILNVAEQVRAFWVDAYAINHSGEEIRLWRCLDVPTFIHSDTFNVDFIQWPYDIDREGPNSLEETQAIAHEFTHVYQYHYIYVDHDYPDGSGSHSICEELDLPMAWVEGTADGIAEYFQHRVRHESYGMAAFEYQGQTFSVPSTERVTGVWECGVGPSHYGYNVESTVAVYTYLMNQRNPGSFMHTLRSGKFDATRPRGPQTLLEYRTLWLDAPNAGIVLHAPGDGPDGYQIAVALDPVYQDLTGVENEAVESGEGAPRIHRVYPLPVHDNLTIELRGTATNTARLRLVQVTGRALRAISIAAGQRGSIAMSTTGLPSGVYFLVYEDSGGRLVFSKRKVVVVR